MTSVEKRIMSPEEYVEELDFDLRYFTGAYAAAKEHGFAVPDDPEAAIQETIDRTSASVEVVVEGGIE